MGAKTGKGMLLCMLYSGGIVVAHVAGDCSLAARRVDVPCLAITFSPFLLVCLKIVTRKLC